MKTTILLATLLLSGCTVVPSSRATSSGVPAASTATVATEPTAEPAAFQCCMDTTTDYIILGEDETFLNAVDAEIAELGPAEQRRYIEFREPGSKLLLQGQILSYEESMCIERVLLQPAQSGAAVMIDTTTCPGFDPQTYNTGFAQTLVDLEMPLTQTPPPDVAVDFVRAQQASNGTWTFAVTLSHPDTGWDDYVDGWHVEAADGAILGTRILLHPHVDEQPFTRSLSDVTLGEGVDEIFIRPHDLVSGYGVDPLRVPLAEAGSGERYEVLRSGD